MEKFIENGYERKRFLFVSDFECKTGFGNVPVYFLYERTGLTGCVTKPVIIFAVKKDKTIPDIRLWTLILYAAGAEGELYVRKDIILL